MARVRALEQRGSGCGLLLAALASACLLLLANRIIVLSLYGLLVPPRWDYARLRTLIQLFLITGLLLPEWWLWDRTLRGLRSWWERPHGPD